MEYFSLSFVGTTVSMVAFYVHAKHIVYKGGKEYFFLSFVGTTVNMIAFYYHAKHIVYKGGGVFFLIISNIFRDIV